MSRYLRTNTRALILCMVALHMRTIRSRGQSGGAHAHYSIPWANIITRPGSRIMSSLKTNIIEFNNLIHNKYLFPEQLVMFFVDPFRNFLKNILLNWIYGYTVYRILFKAKDNTIILTFNFWRLKKIMFLLQGL